MSIPDFNMSVEVQRLLEVKIPGDPEEKDDVINFGAELGGGKPREIGRPS